MKKNLMRILLLFLCLLSLAACGREKGEEPALDYGESSLYTREDMDAAIRLIREEFAGWKGCELHSLGYAGDECQSPENVRWMNELAEGQGVAADLTQCIAFTSAFHSPKKAGNTAWEPDMEYTGWQWWLARSEGGEWRLLTWGYG